MVFCVGDFKTGSVSLNRLLSAHIRCQHEPGAYPFAHLLCQYHRGGISREEFIRLLGRRVQAYNLEGECSGFLPFFAGDLHQMFPNAKFILTIREPLAWADSLFKQILLGRRRLGWHYWDPVFDVWFGAKDFAPEEGLLRELDLYPIRGMLAHWRASQEAVVESVDPDKLLIIRTEDLSDSLPRIEEFLELPGGSLDRESSHSHRAKSDESLVGKIDRQFLDDRLAEMGGNCCGEVL